jgi:alkylhydroperoxidase family enzyme
VAAHSFVAKRTAKVDPAVVDAVRRRAPLADRRLDALVNFTREVVERRGMMPDAEVATFLDAGYTRAQVIEVLLGVGMKTFNNYVDHIAHTPLNNQFKAEAWQPKRKVA